MPAHSFSPVANFYDVLAQIVFGNKLQEAQAANLRYISDNSRILIIGGGSGWILQQVIQHTQHSTIVYLEASDSMLRKSEEKIINQNKNNKIEYRLGTEENIGGQETFDIIIANFFLDLFSPAYLIIILEKLNCALAPAGKWLITDFVQPRTGKFPPWLAQVLFKSMYVFFRLTCGISAAALPDWENYLKPFSYAEINSAYFYHGLVKSMVLGKSLTWALGYLFIF